MYALSLSQVGYLLGRVRWQQLQIVALITWNPAREEDSILLREVAKESDEVFNLVELQSMLWYSPDIAVDPGCQPRGEVTSFEGHKTVFPCKVHVISNCCTVVVYGWRRYSRQR